MKKNVLLHLFLLIFTISGFSQAPVISYTSPPTYTTGTAITPLTPTSTGGAVPASVYDQVSTYAGNGSYSLVNGTGTAASFYYPKSTAVDASGNVYVADQSDNVIRKITSAGVVSTFAGNGSYSFADGTGTAASFASPNGVAVDAAGNVYVADSYNYRVRKITPAGVVSTLAGSGSYGTINGTGTAASFSNPTAVTVDVQGNVYVIDGYLIRKITSTGVVTTFAGSGSSGSTNGTGTAASFYGPSALATDAAGNLYVADRYNNLIRKITPAAVVTTFAGSGVAGSANGNATAASFNYPSGIAVDGLGNIYVSESSGNQIRLISPAGIVSSLAGNGSSGTLNGIGAAASFNGPSGISFGQGNLYVADINNNMIRKLALTGFTINPVLPAGLNFDGTTGTISGTPTSLSAATTYTVNAYNVSGNSSTTISLATAAPAVAPVVTSFLPTALSLNSTVTISGNYLLGATGVTIGGVAASFFALSPTAISAVVPSTATSGSVSVTNPYGTATLAGLTVILPPVVTYTSPQAYTTNTAITPLVPGNSGGAVPSTGVYAQVTSFAGSTYSGSSNGTGNSAYFYAPHNGAFDAAGNMYVADTYNNLIRKITTAGVVTTFAGSGNYGYLDGVGTAASFYSPAGIAIDGLGNLYVSELNNNRIRKITPGGTVTTFAGNGYSGSTNGTGTTASFSGPSALSFDASGNLYVADANNNLIRKISPAGVVSTFAGSGLSGSTNGTGTAASFYNPTGLVVDASGNVFVSDHYNNLIRKITPAGVVTTFAGSGTIGSVNATGTGASFSNPFGLTIDAAGNLYVADNSNNQIRKITPSAQVSTLAGNIAYSSINGVGSAASFSSPSGISYDNQGNLYVFEYSQIRKIAITGYTINPVLPTGLNFDGGTGTISGTPLAVSAATSYAITAYNASGNSTTNLTLGTAIPAIAPVITSFAPTAANLNSSITITGTNLLGATAVTIGGLPVTVFNATSPTSITATVPSTATSGSVTVTNAYGTATLAGLTIIPAPNISYSGSQSYITGTLITPLAPTNSGGVVPTNAYGQVTTFAGSGSYGSLNGTGTAASFGSLRSTAFDAAGNLYIADLSNNLIRKITPAGVVTTLAGSGSSGSLDGTGTLASFYSPMGVAVDTTGNVYVADFYNNKIRKITPGGVVTTFAGNGTSGSVNGTGTGASFYNPSALAFDASGNLFVADAGNNLIRKITPAGVVTTFVGSGSYGYVNGTGTATSFNQPSGIVIDGSGNIFVADRNNNVIRKITTAGVVTTLAGSSSYGSLNGTGTAASFYGPTGITADASGNLYVSDVSNNLVRMITPAGVVTTLAGNLTSGSLNGIGILASFSQPIGISYDGQGNLYVTGSDYLVRKLTITGYVINPVLPTGLSFNGATGAISGTPASVSTSTSYTITAYNASGSGAATLNIATIIPAVAPTISSFTPTSAIINAVVTITGNNFLGATSVSIGGVSALFNILSPTAITAVVPTGAVSGSVSVTNPYGTVSSTGFVLIPPPIIAYTTPVSVSTGSPITAITPTSTGGAVPATIYSQVSTLAGNGYYGSTNGTGAAASFYYPRSTATDAAGNIYVADSYNNVIRKITPAGVTSTFAGSGSYGALDGTGTTASFSNPYAVTVDASSNVYVADNSNNKIRKITSAGVVSTLAGSGGQGSLNGIGNAATFNHPTGIAVDASGTLYVADQSNNLIRKITATGVVTTLAGSGSYGSLNGLGTVASFSSPTGIAVDQAGNVYVTDVGYNLIRKITPAGLVSTLAGSGSYGSTNGTGTAASFYSPSSVCVDAAGTLYVADSYNHEIRLVTAGGVVTTLAGKGTSGSVNDIGTAASFYYPTGVSLDGSGNLYVADQNNYLIRKINISGYTISPATLPVGLSFDSKTGTISGTASSVSSNTYTINAFTPSGNASATLALSTVIPAIAPAITSFTPVNSIPSAPVTITGTNFLGATAVTIGGVAASSFSIVSSTAITAIVAPTATSGSVTITNPYGTSTLSGFVIITAPAITYSSPIVYSTGTAITPLAPTNTGGAVPATSFGQVSTYAGNAYSGAVNSTALSSSFYYPRATALDAAGNLYVADLNNNLIRKITPAGVVTTLAGSGYYGYTDGVGTSASFSQPEGLAIDGTGNIYVADYGNNRIRKITPAGVVSTFAGGYYSGSTNGTGTLASFYGPSAITIDASGNLYVAEAINNLIRKITPAGVVTTVAGAGYSGSANGTGTAATFSGPNGIIADAFGNLYIADSGNNLIRKITSSGLVTTFAGNGIAGAVNGTSTAASFNSPTGLTIDGAGNIYVADQNNYQIRTITSGGVVSTLAGSGVYGSLDGIATSASFNHPSSVTFDGQGSLYVADQNNNTIRKIVLTGYAINQSLPTGLTFNTATGVITGTPSATLAPTSYTIKAFNAAGSSTTTLSLSAAIPAVAPTVTSFSPTASFAGALITITGSNLLGATGVSIGGVAASSFYSASSTSLTAVVGAGAIAGSVTVTNPYGSGTLAGFTLLTAPSITYSSSQSFVVGTAITPFTATNTGGPVPATLYGQVSQLAGSYYSGSANGAALSSTFYNPKNTAFDAAGNIYVADAGNNLIRKISSAGIVSTFAGNGVAGYVDGTGTSASFYSPSGIAVDATGNIFVAENYNNRIRKITPAGVVTTFAGNGLSGSTNGTGIAASFYNPSGLAFDASGNLYVADASNNQIRKITATGVVSTFAGSGYYGSANGTGTAASFYAPTGLVVDGSGNVYIADKGNNLIRKITPTGVVTTFAGSGSYGSTNGTGTAASFYSPTGLAIDAIGNLYVADNGNNLIRKITSTGVVSTIAGNGYYGTVNGVGTLAQLAQPNGVTIDNQNNLYVADLGSNSIRKIALNGFSVSPTLPNGLILDGLTGTISGTPASVSPSVAYTISATNVVGSSTATVNITITPLPAPNISYQTPQIFTTGTIISPLLPTNSGGGIPLSGIVSTYAGTGAFGTNSGTLTTASFAAPVSVAIDPSGNMYVGDEDIGVVQKITPAGIVSTFAGSGNYGSADGTGTAASFNTIEGMVTDAAGNLFVADMGNNKIRKITPAGVVSTFAGGTVGSANGTGTAASFYYPADIAIDSTGNMYIADEGNNLIRKITPAGVVTTLAGNGTRGSTNGPSISASFNGPTGVALDKKGNIYVVDQGNAKIREILTTGTVITLAGSGVRGSTNGQDTTATFSTPLNIAVDAANNVYIADEFDERIRMINPAGLVSTLAGTGVYGANNGPGATATFLDPSGLTFDKQGNLYVADEDNNLIRKIVLGGYTISPALPPGLSFDIATGKISGTPTASSAAVTYTITANNSTGSSKATLSIAVLQPQLITFAAFNPVLYGSDDILPTATAASGLPVTYTSSNPLVATIVNGSIHIVGAGTSIITAAQSGNTVYGPAIVVTQPLTVTPAALTISAANKTKIYGTANPALTATYTGFVNGDDATKLTLQPVLATTATLSSNAGTYPVTVSGAGSANYVITYTAGTITVNTTALTITADNQSRNYGAANPPLTVSYAGFVNGDDATKLSVLPLASTIATSTSPAGTYPITVSGGSSTNYSFQYVAGTLTVIPIPVISSISPSTAGTGTTVTITGVNFTGATAVSLGGSAASSYTVVSPTSITAIVGAGATGVVSVTTPYGNSTLAGFNFVPVPTITAGGTTTFITGGNVMLTASPGTGYTYQWIKDGVNITGANSTTFTATQSGAYTVSITLNGVSQVSGAINVSSVFGLAASNFTLAENSATCKGSANGTITITAAQNLNYTATITGASVNASYPFTTNTTINNLAAGTYNVCFTVAGQPGYQQCFTVVITEPKDLAVYAAVNKNLNNVVLTLTGGTNYIIVLNGVTTQTSSNSVTLTLAKGNNDLTISTDKPCQGTFQKSINLSDDFTAYPNPFTSILNVSTGSDAIVQGSIELYNAAGVKVYSLQINNQSGTIQITPPNLVPGVYVLRLSTGQTEKIFKVVKQ